MAAALTLQNYFDPYDFWATRTGVEIRRRYYARRLSGRVGAVFFGLGEWLLPAAVRRLWDCEPRVHSITVALLILAETQAGGNLSTPHRWLGYLKALAAAAGEEWSWGLGFPWMSKNGFYGPDVPFVTHTPYVMEALLALAQYPETRNEALTTFHGTWRFLERLKVMHEGAETLALSYAPTDEPRIVVNANAYAAFAYAMHAVHGRRPAQLLATRKASSLARWVTRRQGEGGRWSYYADDLPGNFVDGFHSCLVVKNLKKVLHALPELSEFLARPIEQGWRFIRERLFDSRVGLCRRFAEGKSKDPYRWDLYDQAEYLGLLVDFGLFAEAQEFRTRVTRLFKRGDAWWCRLDIFGRRWGKGFLRWGIVPFWYHSARLDTALRSFRSE